VVSNVSGFLEGTDFLETLFKMIDSGTPGGCRYWLINFIMAKKKVGRNLLLRPLTPHCVTQGLYVWLMSSSFTQ
jgi:hypothetical protein